MQAFLQEQIVNDTSKQQMLESTLYSYGLGWTLESSASTFYHEGGISGFRYYVIPYAGQRINRCCVSQY